MEASTATKEKPTPPPSPLQRMKNAFVRRLSPGPISLRARSKTRVGILVITLVIVISALNELRCIRFSCVSRVGFYGGEERNKDDDGSVDNGGFVGGGSVLPTSWTAGISGGVEDSIPLQTTSEEGTDGEVEDNDGGFEFEDGDLVEMSTDDSGNPLKGTTREAGSGKWVDDDLDHLLKGQRHMQGGKAAFADGPAPAPAPGNETQTPIAASKELIAIEGPASMPNATFPKPHTAISPPVVPAKPKDTPPTAEINSILHPIAPEPHTPASSEKLALVPPAVPAIIPDLPPARAPGISGMKFGSMHMGIFGGEN